MHKKAGTFAVEILCGNVTLLGSPCPLWHYYDLSKNFKCQFNCNCFL